MPCPHFQVSLVKRSAGKSAVAGAAYQSGTDIYSGYEQKWKKYHTKPEKSQEQLAQRQREEELIRSNDKKNQYFIK